MSSNLLSSTDAAKQLSDADFEKWYFQQIREKGNMYWNDDCSCDRCREPIEKLEDIRLMHGRRVHPVCFRKDYNEWIDRGKEKEYIDEDANIYFSRVLNTLCSDKYLNSKK